MIPTLSNLTAAPSAPKSDIAPQELVTTANFGSTLGQFSAGEAKAKRAFPDAALESVQDVSARAVIDAAAGVSGSAMALALQSEGGKQLPESGIVLPPVLQGDAGVPGDGAGAQIAEAIPAAAATGIQPVDAGADRGGSSRSSVQSRLTPPALPFEGAVATPKGIAQTPDEVSDQTRAPLAEWAAKTAAQSELATPQDRLKPIAEPAAVRLDPLQSAATSGQGEGAALKLGEERVAGDPLTSRTSSRLEAVSEVPVTKRPFPHDTDAHAKLPKSESGSAAITGTAARSNAPQNTAQNGTPRPDEGVQASTLKPNGEAKTDGAAKPEGAKPVSGLSDRGEAEPATVLERAIARYSSHSASSAEKPKHTAQPVQPSASPKPGTNLAPNVATQIDSEIDTSELDRANDPRPALPGLASRSPVAQQIQAASADTAGSHASASAAQVAQAAPSLQAGPQPAAPDANGTARLAAQIESTIEQLTDARSNAQANRPEMTVRHQEFGAITMRLEALGNDLRATLSARDPGFVPAIQNALAERAVAANGETSTSNGQRGSEQSGSGSSSQSNSQGGNLAQSQGQGWHSDSRYGSSTGSGQGTSQPYSGQTEGQDEDRGSNPGGKSRSRDEQTGDGERFA